MTTKGPCSEPWRRADDSDRRRRPLNTFVLIPGAPGAARYWHRVVPRLQAAWHPAAGQSSWQIISVRDEPVRAARVPASSAVARPLSDSKAAPTASMSSKYKSAVRW